MQQNYAYVSDDGDTMSTTARARTTPFLRLCLIAFFSSKLMFNPLVQRYLIPTDLRARHVRRPRAQRSGYLEVDSLTVHWAYDFSWEELIEYFWVLSVNRNDFIRIDFLD